MEVLACSPLYALEALNQKSMVLGTVERNFGIGIDFADINSRSGDTIRDIV